MPRLSAVGISVLPAQAVAEGQGRRGCQNGYIAVGMQSPTETAFVLPGEWPRNPYMNADRLKALEVADPDMRNGYAVFNEPFAPSTAGAGKPACDGS